MFEIEFEDCGITQPNSKTIGSFDGVAHYEEDSGMAILLDIEIEEFDPEKKVFTRRMLNRFDEHELWVLNGLSPSIKRRYADEINQQIENVRNDRTYYAGVDQRVAEYRGEL